MTMQGSISGVGLQRNSHRVAIELNSAHWGGGYIADIHAVSSLLTDSNTTRKRAALAADYWPEIWKHVEARKEFRRFPAFVQAIILRQI